MQYSYIFITSYYTSCKNQESSITRFENNTVYSILRRPVLLRTVAPVGENGSPLIWPTPDGPGKINLIRELLLVLQYIRVLTQKSTKMNFQIIVDFLTI